PFTEWGPILEKIRRTDPDLAFNTDFAVGDLAAFQNQFVENPTNTLSFGQFGPGLPEYYELTGKNSTGVLWATVKGLLRDKIGSDFAQRFNTRWKAKPGLTTEAIVYDSMNIYFDAVSRANGPEDRRKVCDEIRNIVWRGVCGPSTFNNNRQTTPSYPTEEKDPSLGTPHLYIQLRDGKQEILSPSTYATSKFELPAWFS
ncbi:MAG: branched-chain amino acid transport system substrate-binding protein, partial [Solirubrobacterales bacterium]|nr:branched-chain amino acid transport system substrate-binding protein [Solirubrobacterales bacterium]